jgi:hypothetical protein
LPDNKVNLNGRDRPVRLGVNVAGDQHTFPRSLDVRTGHKPRVQQANTPGPFVETEQEEAHRPRKDAALREEFVSDLRAVKDQGSRHSPGEQEDQLSGGAQTRFSRTFGELQLPIIGLGNWRFPDSHLFRDNEPRDDRRSARFVR